MFPNSMRTIPADGGGGHVSILMRTRDRPILLARALSSVLAQTHPDWHLGLVNDGGARDPVEDMVAEYAGAFDGRIDVVHHPRSLGMEAASNAALGARAGDFVCVHDDDDSWHPDFLAATTGFLRDPVHARFASVVTRTMFVFERIEEGGIVEQSRKPDPRLDAPLDYAAVLAQNPFPPISQLIRRAVMDAIGPFNRELPVLGDWDYNLRILRVGDIGVLPDRLSYYHHRDTDGPAAYGNSVVIAAARHEQARSQYGNSMIRELAETSPGSLGLAHALLREAGRNHDAVLEAVGTVRHDLLQRSYATDQWNDYRYTALRDRLMRQDDELAELRRRLEAVGAVTDDLARILVRLRALRRRLLPRRRQP